MFASKKHLQSAQWNKTGLTVAVIVCFVLGCSCAFACKSNCPDVPKATVVPVVDLPSAPTPVNSITPLVGVPTGSGPADMPKPAPLARPVFTNPAHVSIPRLDGAPKLSDFLVSPPRSHVAQEMFSVSNFIQRNPEDGKPATEPTTAYLGYTHKYLYVAFVCGDNHPSLVRAHLLQRDNLSDDDFVEVMLDTFHDERHAFLFKSNPLGIQADAEYTEGQGSDYSFDTVWDSWGHRTPTGYVVLMRIPFASLSFDHVAPGQDRTWGLVLQRGISRKSEYVFWPRIQHDIVGRLTQEISADGFRDIENGKNLQFEPYVLAHNLRQLNTVDPLNPYFSNKHLQGYVGLDTQFTLRNSLVLDMTFNPDFSQIGINNPAPPNQRFQYYYPELRPFFIENSSYFSTPYNLYYTPSIARPQFGQRLTGKVGPWGIGILNVDDRGPGYNVPPDAPKYGTRANVDIARIDRDLGPRSNAGVIYADREYQGSFNRNGGVDYRTQFKKRWTMSGQVVTSETETVGSPWQSGQAYVQSASYSDLHNHWWLTYNDIASGYTTQTGFLTRADVREPNGAYTYTFRPDSGPLLSHGPNIYFERIWGHTGLPLDFYVDPTYHFNFKHRTSISPNATLGWDQLRPVDYPELAENVQYPTRTGGVDMYSSPVPWLTLGTTAYAGVEVNYSPPANQGPAPVNVQSAHVNVEVKPFQPLDLQNTYEFDRYVNPGSGTVAYESHQVVTRWNVQMNKAWSVNLIGEYLATIPHAEYTSLTNSRDIFGDALLTYLPHPGTAVYLGYTTDYQNLDPSLCTRLSNGTCDPDKPILPVSNSTSFLNDERVIYMKINYLFRF